MNSQVPNHEGNGCPSDDQPGEIRNIEDNNIPTNDDESSVDLEQAVVGGENITTNGDTTHNRVDEDTTAQVTEINVPSTYDENNNNSSYYSSAQLAHRLWTNGERAAYEDRRRESLTAELNRVQRMNFIHFSIMCLIPLVMIGMVLMNSFSDDGECEGYGVAKCERIERSFLNAFANDCFCIGITLED